MNPASDQIQVSKPAGPRAEHGAADGEVCATPSRRARTGLPPAGDFATRRRLFEMRAKPPGLCELAGMSSLRRSGRVWAFLGVWVMAAVAAVAQPTNPPAPTLDSTIPAVGSAVTTTPLTNASAPGLTNDSTPPAAEPEGTAPAPTNPPARVDDSTLRLITERNIFNANRSGRVVRASPRKTVRVDAFALLGTMSYEKGSFAFFDGSNPDFRTALKPAATIADCKVLDIGPKGVKLEANGKPVELPVGSQMRREEGGQWQVAEGTEFASTADSSGEPERSEGRDGDAGSNAGRGRDRSARSDRRGSVSSRPGGNAGATAAPAAAGSSASESEVLKRLLQRREQETK